MERRTALKKVGLLGIAGSSMVSGCLRSTAGTGAGYQWSYDVGGRLDVVSHGTVFGQERPVVEKGGELDGEIFALDAETGDRLWTHGKTGVISNYRTDLTVADGVYVGRGDDAVGSGAGVTYALEIDGTKRWTRDIGSVYRRPVVVDDVVYVGSDDGFVRALDAESGADRWANSLRADGSGESTSVNVIGVSDAVYVDTDDLVALDKNDGSTLWRYGDRDEYTNATISTDVAYVVAGTRIAAVADGKELWHRDIADDPFVRILGVESGRLFVEHARQDAIRLHALDITTGEQEWVSTVIESSQKASLDDVMSIHDGVVYLGADRVRALDATTGSEHWSTAVDGGPVQSVAVAESGVEEEYAVFVHYDDSRLASFDVDGEKTWENSVGERIRNYLVDELVFVATDEGIYALDR